MTGRLMVATQLLVSNNTFQAKTGFYQRMTEKVPVEKRCGGAT